MATEKARIGLFRFARALPRTENLDEFADARLKSSAFFPTRRLEFKTGAQHDETLCLPHVLDRRKSLASVSKFDLLLIVVFANRLAKNFQKLKGWAKQAGFEAFRVYDRDIPEYPYIVEIFKDHAVLWDKSEDWKDAEKNHLPEALAALPAVLNIPPENIILKERQRQSGLAQYEKQDQLQQRFWIQEGRAKYWVNLQDYLDTGLFLDHRPLRQKFAKQSQGLRFLNLFSYTGSVSVAAAIGGAETVSVDLSATYTQWSKDNFVLNQLPLGNHEWVQGNVLEWLAQASAKKFDLIFLDPPTFSNSKRMEDSFEVERDQIALLDSAMAHLQPDGILYFSNNKRKFRMEPELLQKYVVTEITEATLPRDFHDQKIHHCWTFRRS